MEKFKSLSLDVFKGTNFATFEPQKVFPEAELKKLREIKAQVSQIERELKLRKDQIGFIYDTEITSAYKTYMDRLHRYNEAKDLAQALIGKLAQLTGTTTRSLYSKFGLSFDD